MVALVEESAISDWTITASAVNASSFDAPMVIGSLSALQVQRVVSGQETASHPAPVPEHPFRFSSGQDVGS
jgi:hypothetical protein